MEGFRSRPYTSPDRDDASRIELLPIGSQPNFGHQPSTTYNNESAQEPRSNEMPAIKGWPQNPQPLKKKWRKGATLAGDIAVALLPLLFIVLIIATIHLSNSQISAGGHKVKSATTLGPTFFPVMFAAIVGRSLKALASYQVEQGAKLGKLEQMMGSLTIFGTIELQVLLRTFDLFGLALVVLWVFSPLGGQASLRLLDTGVQLTMTNKTLRYLNSDSLSILNTGADIIQELGFLMNALYLSALLTPPIGQAASMDTWGNIKIPTIEKFEQATRSDANGWFAVSPENASYSSLVGLPVSGISTAGSSHFSMESHYMSTSCNVSNLTISGNSARAFVVNITGGSPLDSPLFPYQQRYPDVKPLHLAFGFSSLISNITFIPQCILIRSSVESNITCDGRSCGVTHIRRSKFDQRPPGYTPLSFGLAAQALSVSWPTSAIRHEGESTPTEYFLSDPSLRGLLTVQTGGVSLVGIPADVFSQRVALLLNTYWQCSLAPWYHTGNFPSNESLLSSSSTVDSDLETFNTTIATITNSNNIYVCNKMWTSILFVASSALLVFGVYGAIVKHRTRGPQVLGYVSTMTRDNPYINLPPGGCTLDGLERTRLLKDMEVKLRDVSRRYEVGHIALSAARPYNTEKFAFDRLYADPTYKVAASKE